MTYLVTKLGRLGDCLAGWAELPSRQVLVHLHLTEAIPEAKA